MINHCRSVALTAVRSSSFDAWKEHLAPIVEKEEKAVVPGSSTPTVSTAQPVGDGQTANFEMHFLDVGQALSVLVECDGQYMLYDGGNVDDGSYVVSYLQNLGVEELQYVCLLYTSDAADEL